MKEIVIYTSSTCTYCSAVKEYLTEKNTPFQVKNISENKEYRKELMKLGYMTVPVILVDNEVVVGSDRDKLESLL